jgi:hypothetical protein
MSHDDQPPLSDAGLGRRSLIAGSLGAALVGPAAAQEAKAPSLPTSFPQESVARYGAAGTGRSGAADQAGLQNAIAAANHSGRYVAGIGASYWAHPQDGLFIPAGVYDAGDLNITGNTSPFAALSLWAIPGSVVIRIPDGEYLFKTNERLNWLFVSGITFVGGKGAFQHLFEGVNVNGRFVFERCVFDNYTECAIGNNAQDQPYLEVRGCTFMAAEKSKATGIAWGGYADGCIIEGNAFLRNRYHVKLGPNPSGSIHVLRNDFIRWDGTTPLDAAIWLVPEAIPGRFGATSGWGTIISGNKFGNENMAAGDVRVLVAREGTGATRQERAHTERFDAGGANGAFLSGITIENNRVSSASNTASPFIRSWIAELRNLSYLNNRHDGGAHTYLCEFMGPRVGDYANMNWMVRLDNATAAAGAPPFSVAVSNAPIGPQADLGATEAIAEETILPGTGGDDTSFTLLARADRVEAFTPSGSGVVLKPAANHAGHARAIDVVATAPATGLSGALQNAQSHRQSWLAVDLRRGTPGVAAVVEIDIRNHATGATARKLRYVLADEWRRIRVPFTLPVSDSPTTWQYVIVAAAPAGGVHFLAAALYVYHGREPHADGNLATLGDGKWDGGHVIMGRTHIWEEGARLYVKTDGPPRHATDGRLFAGSAP